MAARTSQTQKALQDAEKSLAAIQEVSDKWDEDGNRVIDAQDAMYEVSEIISDLSSATQYFRRHRILRR